MPNTDLQTKATLTTYPGCLGDQSPYWRAEEFPKSAKNNPWQISQHCVLEPSESQLWLFVLCICLCPLCGFGDIQALVCVLSDSAHVYPPRFPFVSSPLRLKVLSIFVKSDIVYFCRGHLWCKLALYGDLAKTIALTRTVWNKVRREHHQHFNCLLPEGPQHWTE